jgi:hypothetical protein
MQAKLAELEELMAQMERMELMAQMERMELMAQMERMELMELAVAGVTGATAEMVATVEVYLMDYLRFLELVE